MFIDIHVHVRRHDGFLRDGKQAFASPAELIARYDAIGVEKAVLLPGVNPECAYQIQSVEEILDIARENPGRFIPFCNLDPRMLTNSPQAKLAELAAFYKQRGCKGCGEVCANLPLDDPRVHSLFAACQENALPLTFHLAPAVGGYYGLVDDAGLPRLEAALKRFPKLIFLGHSMPFWSEIAVLAKGEDRNGYPKSPVRWPGRLVELLRKYPNLRGDLSAFSGYNAVSRDEAFGRRFLEEFQDRLCFGTDICAPDTATPLADYLLRLRQEGKISETTFTKIARENAVRLLGL